MNSEPEPIYIESDIPQTMQSADDLGKIDIDISDDEDYKQP